MDLAKLNPWNWFKKEDEQDRDIAVTRVPAGQAPPPRPGSLAALHYEIDRLFDHVFDGFGFSAPHLAQTPPRYFRPKVDISGGGNEYSITVELPGVDEKDIHIDLAGDELTIMAERRHEEKSEERGFYRVERSHGAFRRVLTLPEDADAEGLRASYRHGVVTIHVPRKAGAKPPARRIPIE